MSGEKSPVRDAYERLVTLHHKTLLNHGGDVAAGVALAVVEVASLLPDDEKQAVMVNFAETTPEIITDEKGPQAP